MGLLAGGGALLSKNSESPESWHVGRFPWTLNLSRHCLWNHTHRKPKKLAACALYAFRELKELNLIWSCTFAPCKALCKTLQIGYLAAFHEWSSDHVIPWCRQQLPYLHRSSRTQEECGFALANSMLQGVVESWMVTIVLNVTGGIDTVASCFKPTGTPALSHSVQ